MTPTQAARILLRTRQALLLGSFVLSALWAWRDRGLYHAFVALEIRLTHGYDAFFTLLFTFLSLFVLSMLIGAVLTSVMRRRFSEDEWQTLLHATTALLDRGWWRKGRRLG